MILEGLRIADFTWWGVGPLGTRMLADFGAEVIKIEHPQRFDHARTLPPLADERVLVPGQTTELAKKNANLSGIFHNHNRSKFSVTLDLNAEDDWKRFEDLVRISDVVVESFSPKVFDQRGITFDYLRSLNPEIILVRCSGLGHSGPDYLHKTAGPINQALSGVTHMSGLPGHEPAGWGFSYLDNTGAFYVTMAVLQAVLHRMRTGEGQYVDVSIVEAGVGLLGPTLLDHQVNGTIAQPPGNCCQEPVGQPENVYACAGDDRWCAISVHGDSQWSALCEAMEMPSLVADSRFANAGARAASREELDRIITDWTSQHSPEAVMAILQERGVPCGVVQNGRDLAADPQLAHLGTFPRISHPQIKDAMVEGVAMHFSRTPGGPQRPGPMLGEHNAEIFEQLIPQALSNRLGKEI